MPIFERGAVMRSDHPIIAFDEKKAPRSIEDLLLRAGYSLRPSGKGGFDVVRLVDGEIGWSNCVFESLTIELAKAA